MPYLFTPVDPWEAFPWPHPEHHRLYQEADRFKDGDAAHWPTPLKYAVARNLTRMGCRVRWIDALRAMTPRELLALRWVGRRRLPLLLALLTPPPTPDWVAEE